MNKAKTPTQITSGLLTTARCLFSKSTEVPKGRNLSQEQPGQNVYFLFDVVTYDWYMAKHSTSDQVLPDLAQLNIRDTSETADYRANFAFVLPPAHLDSVALGAAMVSHHETSVDRKIDFAKYHSIGTLMRLPEGEGHINFYGLLSQDFDNMQELRGLLNSALGGKERTKLVEEALIAQRDGKEIGHDADLVLDGARDVAASVISFRDQESRK